MYIARKEDLSVIYAIKGMFTDAPNINIVDGFPETDLVIPTISVESTLVDIREFELGNREGLRIRRWSIDIFASTKSQRDDIGYRILEELKNGIIVYNYDEGFPPDNSPSVESHLNVVSRRMTTTRIFPALTEKMYYRATIQIVASNDVV